MADTEEIKLFPDKLDNNIEDMSTLKNSIINYKPQLTFEKSKGSSVDSMIGVYNQYIRMQCELAAFYANTETALKLTKDSFVAVDNLLGDFFKELTVSE